MQHQPSNIALLILLSFPLIAQCVSPLTYDKHTLLNWCLQGRHHKKSPGKEKNLENECKPWQYHSCCTAETSVQTHDFKNQYNFDLNHCESQVNKKLSDECRKHFIRDLCFYECEPHIGLWVVNVKRKIAKERFFEVPLCASSCEQWWNACRDQYTCAYNWQTDFSWENGVNRCNTTCKQFKEVYKSSVDFCESVFDHSWKYTNDSKPCMRISFDKDSENNNRKVAEYYIDRELAGISSSDYITLSRLLIVALVSLVILNVNFIVF